MSKCPLYDNIKQSVDNLLLINDNHKKDIIKIIKNNPKDPHLHKNIYIIIRLYQMEQGGTNTMILPYNGKTLKSGIKFDLDKFPNLLINYLYTYIQMFSKIKKK